MGYQFLFMDYETRSMAGVSKATEKSKKKKGKKERGIKKVGLDNYAKHPSTEILMLAWALDHEDVQLWQPRLEPMPKKLLDALIDAGVLKIAWHSPFEYKITAEVLPRVEPRAPFIPLSQWRDPIILAHNLSLPGKLEKVGQILQMQHQKDERGEKLVERFSFPASVGGDQTLFGIAPPLFRDWESHPQEWEEFCEYCKQDVKTERDLWYRMLKAAFPEEQWAGWLLDQKINWFGIPTRRDLAQKGLRMARRFIHEQNDLLRQKTGLKNPNSDVQIKGWLSSRGWPWKSLRANLIKNELKNPASTLTPEAKDVLRIRQSTRKSSYTKLEKVLDLLSDDNRLKNQFRYMGAPRTGRWASGGGEDSSVQVQNLSRGEKAVKNRLDRALELLDKEDYDTIVKEFTNTPDKKDSVTVVEFVITLLRSLFQAPEGKKFVVADKNAIENRMLGWAAGCKSILDVFRTCNDCGFLFEDYREGSFVCPKCGCKKHRDPYIAFGTNMYSKTYAEMWKTYKVDKNEEERQNSKPAVLGAGYGLGGGEMFINDYGDEVRGGLWGYALNVCGVDMPKEMAHKAVRVFRESYPEVVQFWTDLEEAFKQVLINGGEIAVGRVTWDKKTKKWVEHPTKGQQCVLIFSRRRMENGGYIVCLQLPSGRVLHYLNAEVTEEIKKGVSKRTGENYEFKSQTIYYDGIEHSASYDDTGKKKKQQHKWGRVKTYGGKICENVIQAMSRDDLLNSMFLADRMGFMIWGLFHDEVATEVDDDSFGLGIDDLIWCLTQIPIWAPGFLLGADGYESKVYKK